MYIDFASLPSIQRGRRGIVVFVDDDALGVAKQLEEMQFPEGYGRLRLAWNEFRQEFVVVQLHPDGGEYIVTGARKADQRLVDRVRQITSPSYNLADELDKIDEKADRENSYAFSQIAGDYAEKLAHAIRQDTGMLRSDINRRKGVRVWQGKT